MKQFEYSITMHPAESFKQLVYFCSDTGECALPQVPNNQVEMLENLLNKQGGDGWELVQIFLAETAWQLFGNA